MPTSPAQTTLVTRAGKGSPLTNNEGDTNLTNLNAGKLDVQNNLTDVVDTVAATNYLGVPDIAITYAIALS